MKKQYLLSCQIKLIKKKQKNKFMGLCISYKKSSLFSHLFIIIIYIYIFVRDKEHTV